MCAFSEIKSGWVLLVTILVCIVLSFLFMHATNLSSKKENEVKEKEVKAKSEKK